MALREFDFINRIRDRAANQHVPDRATDLVLGIGDDAAVWREREGRETLITVDLLVEDVDFKLDYAAPRWLGHKALAVSLSDVAAMGGAARFALLTLGIPNRAQISNHQSPSSNHQSPSSNLKSEIFLEEFFAGYFALAEQHGVTLVGGDISSTPDRLTIDSIVIGQCRAGGAVRRGGARAGDAIYLTGTIGASAAGLKLLIAGARVDAGEESLRQNALRAHLRPDPRVEFGGRMGDLGLAHSMIDVSDGLIQDLAHICEESGVAAIIDFDAVPVADEVSLVAQAPEAAFEFAAGGGEDFELLLTANKDDEAKLFEAASSCEIKLTRIGDIVSADQTLASSPVLLRRNAVVEPLSNRGFDHFLL